MKKYQLICPECGKGNKAQEETCDNCYMDLTIKTGFDLFKQKLSRHVRSFIRFCKNDLVGIAILAALIRFIVKGIL